MTDLDALDVQTPRPEELCADLVRRLDPWWGYAFAGALLALGGAVLGVLALITITPRLGIAPKTVPAQIAAIVALVLGEVGAFVVFTRWRQSRIARKRTLIRDGWLMTATVLGHSRAIEKGRTDIELDVTGGEIVRTAFNVWFGPETGSTIRVLYMPTARMPHLLAFDAAGRMYSGHIKSVRRRR